MKPIFDLEMEATEEYESEVSSQVASNIHETSSRACSDSHTNSSNVTNPIAIRPLSNAISLDYLLSDIFCTVRHACKGNDARLIIIFSKLLDLL
ncbi:hypothetical protein Lalb_Chr15g0085031 [Lupinus albus]|uniref:Uncharacterized protein n=1 Tax=Lupinus albus TaxID=3870 RepID=A0A6A4PDV4_LUPAL|nr:hypothetical protein Lalb_Chr15g0085031 [Lupinus albus]